MAGAIPAGEKLGWGLGKVEEVLGKVLVQGIEIWWPEEGDRRERAMAERADELHSVLVDVRRKEEMTAGAHNQVKYLGVTIQYREFIVFLPYFWLLFACVKYYVKFLL